MNIRQWWISRNLLRQAYKAKAITGLPASILASQCVLETGWLKFVPKDYNTNENSYNLFGIKAKVSQPHVNSITHEYYDGVKVRTFARFRKYKNYEESFIDYGNLILGNPRYKEAVANKGDPRKYVEEIWKAGYATDPAYVSKVIQIAENCGYIPKEKV